MRGDEEMGTIVATQNVEEEGMATQTLVGSLVQGSSVQGSQAGLGNAGSTGKPCWRCVKH